MGTIGFPKISVCSVTGPSPGVATVFILRFGTGRWNAIPFGAAIGLFKFGEYAFGAAIGLFTISVGGLSCCGDSLCACAAAGIEDNRASAATAAARRII